MKKTLAGVLVVALVVVGALVLWRAMPQEAGKPTIGIVLPLSGSMAEYGENAKEGIMLANADLGADGFRLIFQDSRGDPQETVSAVRRLVDVDGVRYIVGGLTSTGVLAAAPYAQRRGVLFFSPAASAPGIPEIGNLILRNWPSDDAIGRLYGEYVASHGVQAVAIVYVSNDYGNTNAAAFGAGFEKNGGVVLLRRSYAPGATDFKAIVSQLVSLDKDARVLVVGYPDEYRAFFQELASSSVAPGRILVTDTFFSEALVKELGARANGVVCGVAAKPGPDYAPRREFIERYSAKFRGADGKPRAPGLVSDTAYDAIRLVALAIKHTDASPPSVSAYLVNDVRNYQGVAGVTNFTETGDVQGQLALYEVVDDKFVPWK